MHDSVRRFVADSLESFASRSEDSGRSPRRVLEFGSRDVNGGVRDLFPDAEYTGIDLLSGKGVDYVADAIDFDPGWRADCVVCTSVLEHSPYAREILENAFRLLAPGGVLIITAAADPWPPHSVDGEALRPGEYYHNIDPGELAVWLPSGATVKYAPSTGDLFALLVKEGDPVARDREGVQGRLEEESC